MVVIEFSKSNRAACRTCNQFIDKDVMKLGTTKSNDGYLNMDWHHENCFWTKRASQYYKRKGKKINVLLKYSQFSGQEKLNPDQVDNLNRKIDECNLRWGTKEALEKAGIEVPVTSVVEKSSTKKEKAKSAKSTKKRAINDDDEQPAPELEQPEVAEEEPPQLFASGRVMRKKSKK